MTVTQMAGPYRSTVRAHARTVELTIPCLPAHGGGRPGAPATRKGGRA